MTHGQCDARPTVTFPAAGHHRPLTGTKLYCLVTEAHVCEQLAQGCYLKAERPRCEPRPSESQVQRSNHYATWPHMEPYILDGHAHCRHSRIRCRPIKLAVTVHQCLNGRAPPYQSEHVIPVSSADTRRHLRSANRHLLAVPRFRLNTYGRRAFSVAGLMAWNSLPDFIRDPSSSTDCFRRLLKTYLFARYWCIQHIRGS